jgi:hypothetical protein
LQTITPSDLTVSAAKIQTSAVTTDKIADANITAAKLNGAQSGSAPIYAARAWVNFNGTGTVAIRASGNVSSITDNGTGDYTVNFTTAMADANYAVVSQIDWQNTAFGATLRANWIVSQATGNSRLRTGLMASAPGITAEDQSIICVSVLR